MLKNTIKLVAGSRRVARCLSRFNTGNIIVLMYHDLCESNYHANWLRVTGSRFEDHLIFLKNIGAFISASDLDEQMSVTGDGLKFLVTFDDGFVNHFRIALPILKRHDIPALFFISTENKKSGDPFWFDIIITPIQYLRLKALDLRHLGLNHYHFPVENGPRRWETVQLLLSDIKSLGNSRTPAVQNILKYMDDRFGDKSQAFLENMRPINRHEISLMMGSGLCHFGSHAHSHDILTYLRESEIRDNFNRSKSILEELTGLNIAHVSYPNGNTNRMVETLGMECGFEYGYSTQAGFFSSSTNRMRIPRIPVSGYDSPRKLLWKINREFMKSTLKIGVLR